MEINDELKNLLQTARTGGADGLLSSLKKEDVQKIKSILSSPEATKKILDSPQAKELMKNLMKDGRNHG